MVKQPEMGWQKVVPGLLVAFAYFGVWAAFCRLPCAYPALYTALAALIVTAVLVVATSKPHPGGWPLP
jgi:hypothetical protein